MSLSPEMTRYITTGHCPYCDVVILGADYVRYDPAGLKASAETWGNLVKRMVAESELSPQSPQSPQSRIHYSLPSFCPDGAKVRFRRRRREMQCETCWRMWPIQTFASGEGPSPTSQTSAATRLPSTSPARVDYRRQQRLARSGFDPSKPVRKIDLNGCRVIQLKEEREVETFLSTERQTYRNNSQATVTQERSISQSITRAVTTESTHLRASNAEAGITILGFVAIQGQIQQQLSQHYSVATENILTFNEKTTIEIPPYTTVEHIIHWKVVSTYGIAVLGKPATPMPGLAQVPFEIPLRLTYTVEVNNVPGPESRND